MCVYIYVYIHVHAYICIFSCVCIHIYIYIYVCVMQYCISACGQSIKTMKTYIYMCFNGFHTLTTCCTLCPATVNNIILHITSCHGKSHHTAHYVLPLYITSYCTLHLATVNHTILRITFCHCKSVLDFVLLTVSVVLHDIQLFSL